MTTNLPFSEWTKAIPDARRCQALLESITGRAHIIETGEESYRFPRTFPRTLAKRRRRPQERGGFLRDFALRFALRPKPRPKPAKTDPQKHNSEAMGSMTQ